MDREGNRPFPILVVDDKADIEPSINLRMRPRIRYANYLLFFASDGVNALEILPEATGAPILGEECESKD